MERITPELHLISTFDGDTTAALATDSRELDFNLARRSGVVVNRVDSQIAIWPDTTSGLEVLGVGMQELDLDPDNEALQFSDQEEDIRVDSSRVLRHYMSAKFDTAAGLAHPTHTWMHKDWHHVPPNERPVSITNLRHHFGTECTVSCQFHVELHVDYFIVELSLLEIGILNAGRR